MITSMYIALTLNLLFNVILLVLQLSSLIGCVLVILIAVIVRTFARSLGLITALLIVVYKDWGTFTQDLSDNFSYFIAFVVENIIKVWDGTIGFSSSVICAVISGFYHGLINFFRPFLFFWWIFMTVINLLRNVLLLITSSVWTVVIYMTSTVLYGPIKLIILFSYMLKNILMYLLVVGTSILNGVLNIFYLIYLIPFGSIFGVITILILLFYLTRSFHTICCYFKIMLISFIKHSCITFHKIWASIIQKEGDSIQKRNKFNVTHELTEDRLCVVCLNEPKEVIVLPCGHLCLCVNCKYHFMKFQKHCPVCRTDIERLMKVYV